MIYVCFIQHIHTYSYIYVYIYIYKSDSSNHEVNDCKLNQYINNP